VEESPPRTERGAAACKGRTWGGDGCTQGLRRNLESARARAGVLRRRGHGFAVAKPSRLAPPRCGARVRCNPASRGPPLQSRSWRSATARPTCLPTSRQSSPARCCSVRAASRARPCSCSASWPQRCGFKGLFFRGSGPPGSLGLLQSLSSPGFGLVLTSADLDAMLPCSFLVRPTPPHPPPQATPPPPGPHLHPMPPQLIAMSPNGVKCAGAMTRDVAVYAVAISSVLLAFALGKVGPRGGLVREGTARPQPLWLALPSHVMPISPLGRRCPAISCVGTACLAAVLVLARPALSCGDSSGPPALVLALHNATCRLVGSPARSPLSSDTH
jgi:hypothetical protein